MTKPAHLGTFRVHRRFFDHLTPGHGANLFTRMVVVDVHHNWAADEVIYTAVHPDFDVVPEGGQAPEYRPVFAAGETAPRWVRADGSPAARPAPTAYTNLADAAMATLLNAVARGSRLELVCAPAQGARVWSGSLRRPGALIPWASAPGGYESADLVCVALAHQCSLLGG